LSSYFTALAVEMNAPPAARHANAIVKGWFEARVRSADRSPAQVEPLLQLIERDPMSMRDEMAACTIRAADDPGFDAFARARSR
jgi:hypothetical protein